MDDILLLPFGVGTHVVGPLPDFWASGNPVGLGNGVFCTHPKNLAGCTSGHGRPTWVSESSIFAQKTAFLESKRALSSVFWAFFDLGTSLAEPGLLKTGLNLNLVAGGSLDVIESTSFPSKTAPPDLPRPPGELPDPPREVLEIICIFCNFSQPKFGPTATCSPPPGAASRPRVGARRANGCLNVLKKRPWGQRIGHDILLLSSCLDSWSYHWGPDRGKLG